MEEEKKPTKRVMFGSQFVGEIPAGDFMAELKASQELFKVKGINLPPIPIERQMFAQARSFAEAGAMLYRGDGGMKIGSGVVGPFVVMSVFSIELYLKTLAAVHNVPKLQGHELVDLWGKMPAAARDIAKREWPASRSLHKVEGAPQLRECLARLSNVFVEWRYVYENDVSSHVNIPEVVACTYCLDAACRAAFHARGK
jgi:hypothetical protein